MDFYHGTVVAGLAALRPRSRHHGSGEPVVYATDSAAYALVFIRDTDIDWVTAGVSSDGCVHYDERFEHQLEALYKGLSGYVYTLADVGFGPLEGKRGVWAARAEAPVVASRFIPDVHDALLEAQAGGGLRIHAYSALSAQARRENDETMIVSLFAMDLDKLSPRKAAFFREHFPLAWSFVARNPHKRAEYIARIAHGQHI